MSYEGNMKLAESRPKIILKNNATTLPTIITQFQKRLLQIWYKPIKVDSLALIVTKDSYKDNFSFKIKDQKKDTLSITALQNGTLNFRDRFTLETVTPLVGFDNSKIQLTNKDSTAVAFTNTMISIRNFLISRKNH
jgi:hypothetical protein